MPRDARDVHRITYSENSFVREWNIIDSQDVSSLSSIIDDESGVCMTLCSPQL